MTLKEWINQSREFTKNLPPAQRFTMECIIKIVLTSKNNPK